jgi:hypothetical protein
MPQAPREPGVSSVASRPLLSTFFTYSESTMHPCISIALVIFVLVSCVHPLAFPVLASTADGDESALLEVGTGRWALLFLPQDCSGADSARAWFATASTAFPEMQFAIVTRGAGVPEEVVASVDGTPGGVRLLADPNWLLAESLELTEYPMCMASVDGVFVRELAWPFTEAELVRILAEALLVEVSIPDPDVMIGQQAPGFWFSDDTGATRSFSSLSLPALLIFVNPFCNPCLDVIPLGADIPDILTVVVVVAATGEPITDTQMAELAALRVDLGGDRATTAFAARDVLPAYNIARSPTLVLVDEARTITWTAQNMPTREALTAALVAACRSL